MVCIVALAFLAVGTNPQQDLMNALLGVQKLDSFSATIEQQDSSGLFPGRYTQELRWKKGGKFDLRVTAKSNGTGAKAPDYYCDGTQVISVYPDQPERSAPIDQGPNVSPGWEVCGGPILSSLMRTHFLDIVKSPPEGMKFSYEDGKASEWQGENVREVILHWEVGGRKANISMFLSMDGSMLVGYQADMVGKVGTIHYRNRRLNPTLPDNLGKRG